MIGSHANHVRLLVPLMGRMQSYSNLQLTQSSKTLGDNLDPLASGVVPAMAAPVSALPPRCRAFVPWPSFRRQAHLSLFLRALRTRR